MDIKTLLEKRSECADQIQKIREEYAGAEFPPDVAQRWEDVNNSFDELSRNIERTKRAEEVQRSLEISVEDSERQEKDFRHVTRRYSNNGKPVARGCDWDYAVAGWAKYHRGLSVSERSVEAAQICGVNLRSPDFEFPLLSDMELRTLDSSTATKGTETISTGFIRSLEESMKAIGRFRSAATVYRTPSGNNVTYPIVDDVGNPATVIGERLSAATGGFSGAETSDPGDATFGSVTLQSFKYGTNLPVSFELLEDNEINLAARLGQMLGKRLARGQNTGYTTGNGTSAPQGVVTGLLATSAAVKTNVDNSGITANDFVESYHSVDPDYRDNASWMMHDSVIADVRALREGTGDTTGGASRGNFIWQPGLQAGQPDTILGKPVILNQAMDDVTTLAAAQEAWVFGDLSYYLIRDVNFVRIRQLTEILAYLDSVVFQALHRTDGRCIWGTGWSTPPIIVEQVQ